MTAWPIRESIMPALPRMPNPTLGYWNPPDRMNEDRLRWPEELTPEQWREEYLKCTAQSMLERYQQDETEDRMSLTSSSSVQPNPLKRRRQEDRNLLSDATPGHDSGLSPTQRHLLQLSQQDTGDRLRRIPQSPFQHPFSQQEEKDCMDLED